MHIYGVHLTLKAYKHSTNDIKWKGRQRRLKSQQQSAWVQTPFSTHSRPIFLPATWGLVLLFVLFTSHMNLVKMSAMEPAVDKLEALVIITSFLLPFDDCLCIKSTNNVYCTSCFSVISSLDSLLV